MADQDYVDTPEGRAQLEQAERDHVEAERAAVVEPVDTYTPGVWVFSSEDQRYEEYVRVRTRAADLSAQCVEISTMLSDAGIGPCTLREGVRKLIERRDAALSVSQAPEWPEWMQGSCWKCGEAENSVLHRPLKSKGPGIHPEDFHQFVPLPSGVSQAPPQTWAPEKDK